MKNIKTAYSFMKYNWSTIWRFEALYTIFAVALLSFPNEYLSKYYMSKLSLSFISSDNLGVLVSSPLFWLSSIIVALISVLVCMFEASALIIIFDASRQRMKIGVIETIKKAASTTRRIFGNKGKNLSLIIVLIILMPYLGMGVYGLSASTVQLPEFILEAINKNTLYSISLFLTTVLLLILVFRWLFTLHYFVLDGMNAKEARRESCSFKISQRLISFLIIALIVFVSLVILCLIIVLLIFLLANIYIILDFTFYLNAILFSALFAVTLAVIILAISLCTPLSTLAISVAFYRLKNKNGLDPCDYRFNPSPIGRHHNVIAWVITLLLISCLTGGMSYLIYNKAKGDINVTSIIDTLDNSKIKVTAHRGGSHAAPENTMAAFKTAYQQGADWIELDVQMSKDGKLIIMHDTSFERTCNYSANTWELTWEEIQKLDASNGMSEFSGEPVPSLEEVIDWAKTTGMKINIEIKPTGHEETSLEQSVVNMINEKDFKDQCWVASLEYSVITKVKEIDPQIETLLNMVLAYGDISKMQYADNFSLESSNITEEIVEDVHKANKQLAAWTVNDENNMRSVILSGIDNIVTDETIKAKKQVSIYSKEGLKRLVEYAEDFKVRGFGMFAK